MRSRLGMRITVTLLAAAVLSGCAGSPPQTSQALRATVSIVPQQYFVQRVGGEHVQVDMMVLPGASPATYEPKPAQLTALAEADVYFSIGVPFEDAWLPRIAAANPEMEIVDTAWGIQRVPVDGHYKVALGSRPPAVGEGRDPHIWLSPRLVKVQVQTICEALVALDPSHQDAYQENRDRFLADIDQLIHDIEGALQGISQRKFMAFHPSWGYFGDDLRLEMIPVEVGGQEPSPSELADLVSTARAEGIRVVFAQPEFSTRDAQTIAQEIGGEVLLVSPLALDWLKNLRSVATTFAEVLSE
jgi:zinc transport system substrate-binding protein